MPFERLEDLSKDLPSLQHQMLRLMSREVSNESQMIALLNHSTAEERLASFIVSLAERFQRRGFSSTDFFLPMSRQDIGSYLGLALETVSRLFTRFQELNLLKVKRKHIEILDMEALKGVISHKTECQSVKAS
jgi:CRP/FNR family transcriptional regulator